MENGISEPPSKNLEQPPPLEKKANVDVTEGPLPGMLKPESKNADEESKKRKRHEGETPEEKAERKRKKKEKKEKRKLKADEPNDSE